MSRIIAEALEQAFKNEIATTAEMPFEQTGVTVPKPEIWDAYARAVARALWSRLDHIQRYRTPIYDDIGMQEDALGDWVQFDDIDDALTAIKQETESLERRDLP